MRICTPCLLMSLLVLAALSAGLLGWVLLWPQFQLGWPATMNQQWTLDIPGSYAGRPLNDWVSLLDSDDREQYALAEHMLLTFAEDRSGPTEARALAVFAIGRSEAPSPDRTAERVCRLLENDPELLVRSEAAGALHGIGHVSPLVLRTLVGALTDEEVVQQRASGAIECFGYRARPLIPDLLNYLDHPRTSTRCHAIYALGCLQAVEALPDLCRLMNNPDPSIRLQAGVAIAQIKRSGEMPAPALP